MNARDTNILLEDYLTWRAMGLDPQMIAFKERIMEEITKARQLCEMEGYTQEQLDALWEDWKRGNRS